MTYQQQLVPQQYPPPQPMNYMPPQQGDLYGPGGYGYNNQSISLLSQNPLYQQRPPLGNFGVIECMVTASTPIAAIYNGQLQLGEWISQLMHQNPPGGVTFGQINEVYEFNLYKVIKPKIIYSRYTSRVLPDVTASQALNTNGYYPKVTFKIDYDSCCVGQMTLLMTTDISIKDTLEPVIINGYSSNGVDQLTVPRRYIQSIQYSYSNDFLYNYIDHIYLGFAATGGGAVIQHQKIPVEIAKIYHSIITGPGVSQTIRRATREDVFSIQHNPYHQYGNFSFAVKADNQLNSKTHILGNDVIRGQINPPHPAGYNEIAMYWVDAKLKEIDFTKNSYSQYDANKQNWTVGLTSPQVSNIKLIENTRGDGIPGPNVKYLSQFDITYISDITYGSLQTVYSMILPQVDSTITTTTDLCLNGYISVDLLPQQPTSGVYGLSAAQTSISTFTGYTVEDADGNALQSIPQSNMNQYNIINKSPLQCLVFSGSQYMSKSGRQQCIAKFNSLIEQKQYPEFEVEYNGTNGGYRRYIIVPYIVIFPELQTLQLCTSIIAIGQIIPYHKIQFSINLQNQFMGQTQNYMILRQAKLAIVDVDTDAGGNIYLQDTPGYDYSFTSATQPSTGTLKLALANGSTIDTQHTLQIYAYGLAQNLSQSIKLSNLSGTIAFISYTKVYQSDFIMETQPVTSTIIIPGFDVSGDVSTSSLTGYSLLTQSSIDNVYYIQATISETTDEESKTTYTPQIQILSTQQSDSYYIFTTYIQNNNNSVQLQDADYFWNAPHFYRFTNYPQLPAFIKAISGETQDVLFKSTGAVSPYLNTGSFNTVNLEIEKYDENDFALNGLAWYFTMNSNNTATYDRRPDPMGGMQKLDTYRYNAAILNNHDNEEFHPTIMNQDYQSIHTYRKHHGIVDFYFPLSFLFTCDGVRNSFPHYACSAQSMVIGFDFISPLSLMNVCIAVDPQFIDPCDFSRDARLYINRFNNHAILQNNVNNSGFVLFYQRYQWIPELLDVITEYTYYAWVIKNYERTTRIVNMHQLGNYQELIRYNRSVFYTKIWSFIVSAETVMNIDNHGMFINTVPIQVNRYNLPIWDVLNYEFVRPYAANSLNGRDRYHFNHLMNSVYNYVPFDSIKMETDSSIQMTDELPFRFQQFNDYLMLDHTQVHSALPFNNLLQFNLDPVYYQEGAPNALYSPAYAPQFRILYKPKHTMYQVEQYGVIIISECINISYINNHVILSKYITQ